MLSNSSGMQIYENHLLVWYSHADCSNSLTDVILYVRMYTSVYILTLFKSPDFWGLFLLPIAVNGNSLSAQWSQFLPLPHSPLNVRCWAGIKSLTHGCSAAASFLWIQAAAAPVGWVPEPLLLPQQSLRTCSHCWDGWMKWGEECSWTHWIPWMRTPMDENFRLVCQGNKQPHWL